MRPKIILHTERLRLAEFHPGEAAFMYRLNLDPEVIRYTGDPPFESEAEAHRFLEDYQDVYRAQGFGRWSVWRQPENDYIGWCGLKRNEEGLIDIGFRFFREHWNRGYATEAASACLTYGFQDLDMDEIIGRAHTENKASIRVLEKIGMRFWKYGACEGFTNAAYYSIRKPSLK